MNIRDLRYFLTVAELGHFGQAAEQCHVSQPTLSGQIKKLEQELGVTLLERTNRRVMVTDIGKQVAVSARRILQEVGSIKDIAENAHDPLSGKFRLGAFPTLSTYIFPDLVQKIKLGLPNLRLILLEEKTAALIDKLKQGEIDAALLALPVYEDFLISQPLFDDMFYLAVPPSHPLTAHNAVTQGMISPYPLLLLEEGHCLRDQALEFCHLHGIGEEQDFKATGLETLRYMVKAGTGITLMPHIAKQKDELGICYIPFEPPAPTRTIGLVWRKTTARKAVMEALVTLTKNLY